MKKPVAMNAYLAAKVRTASPLELIVIAYEGAINFLEVAKTHLQNKQNRDAGEFIIKAQKVIRELRNALDMDIKEVSENLFILYRSMDVQLVNASRSKDTARIDQVIRMLTDLKNSWLTISKSTAPAAQPVKATAADYQYLNVYK